MAGFEWERVRTELQKNALVILKSAESVTQGLSALRKSALGKPSRLTSEKEWISVFFARLLTSLLYINGESMVTLEDCREGDADKAAIAVIHQYFYWKAVQVGAEGVSDAFQKYRDFQVYLGLGDTQKAYNMVGFVVAAWLPALGRILGGATLSGEKRQVLRQELGALCEEEGVSLSRLKESLYRFERVLSAGRIRCLGQVSPDFERHQGVLNIFRELLETNSAKLVPQSVILFASPETLRKETKGAILPFKAFRESVKTPRGKTERVGSMGSAESTPVADIET